MEMRPLLLCGFFILLSAGCSSGSSSSGDDGDSSETAAIQEGDSVGNSNDTSESVPLTGVFIDSAVQGLMYQTDTQSGVTNLAGEFNYLANETVEFFVGDIAIGMGGGGEFISPADLVTEGEDFTLDHQRNLIRFLQTLDVDGDPTNGIEIRSDIDDFTDGISLDFDLPVEQFEGLADLTSLLQNATNGADLVSESAANAHFLSTLEGLGIELESQQTTNIDLVFNLDAEETSPYTVTEHLDSAGSDINTPYVDPSSDGNAYTGQTISITDPAGIVANVIVVDGDGAASIATNLSNVHGVSASSFNQVSVDFTDASNTFQLNLLGEVFPLGATVEEIAAVINSQTNGSLPGITASFVGNQLAVMADQGLDLDFFVTGGENDVDTLLFTGSGGSATLTASGGLEAVVIGGFFNVTLDYGYELAVNPTSPSTESVAGTLFAGPIVPVAIVENGFDPADDSTYNHSTSVNIYDSLGNIHPLSIYFVADQSVNRWSAYFLIDGEDVGDPDTTLPEPEDEAPTRAQYSLTFNADGSLNQTLFENPLITNWIPKGSDGLDNGAISPSNFTVDIAGSTQLGGGFWVGSDAQGLVTPGQVKTVNLHANLDSRETRLESRIERVTATGSDINAVINNTTSGIFSNGYTAQTFTITDSLGSTTELFVTEGDTAALIGSGLNAVTGVSATVSNQVVLGFSSAENAFVINLNGHVFSSGATAEEMATAINNETNAGLPGISASASSIQLIIYGTDGGDLDFNVSGGDEGVETVLFTGSGAATAVTASVSPQAITVGGEFVITLDEDYSISTNPTAPSTESVSGTLLSDPVVPATIVSNAFDSDRDATYNHKTTAEIADSLGNLHELELYFVKEEVENTWTVYILIDGENVGDPNPALPDPQDTFPSIAQYSLIFKSDGSLDGMLSETIFITNWTPINSDGEYNGALGPLTIANGAMLPLPEFPSNSNFVIDISDSTLLGNEFEVNALSLENYAR